MPSGVYSRPSIYKGKYKLGTIHDTPCGRVEVIQEPRRVGANYRLVIRFVLSGAVQDVQTNNLSQGKVKDFMWPSVYGLGYIGSAIRIPQRGTSEIRRVYDLWANMLRRVTSDPAYSDVQVDSRWLNFTTFLNTIDRLPGYAEWLVDSTYCLDKDLRVIGSRTYGLDTCWFIPAKENISGKMG